MARSFLLPVTAALTASMLLASCSPSPEAQTPTEAPSGAGTGSQQPTNATASPTGQTSEAPTSEVPTSGAPTSDLQPFGQQAEPAQSEASDGAQLQLVDLSSGEHEGYDRVVLTFKGAGTPGWRVDYADSPSEAGSGRPIETEGDASLQVQLTGMALPTEGDGQVQPDATMVDLPEIEEVYLAGWFEGEVQLVLGIDSAEAPFRVFALTDPTRLVIDVRHTDD